MTASGLSVPYIDLGAQQARLRPAIEAAIARVLAHGRYILGPEIGELEKRLADFVGRRHAITCASGTDALLIPLIARGIGPGDAVFAPAFGFVAAAEVAVLVGATPVFVDVDVASFNLDPASLDAAVEAAEKQGLRPAAVIPNDLFGAVADYAAIGEIARDAGLFVIEDAAQSLGAEAMGRRAGAFGEVAGTSFFPSKPLGCYGDGGAIFTDDDAFAERLKLIRVHGQGAHKYHYVAVGLNGRLDTLQAAILLAKLDIFDDEIAARGRIAARYNEGLADVAEVPRLAPGATSAWAQYTIRVENRDAVAAALKDMGIPTAIHYPKPLTRQPAYRDFPVAPGGVPVSEALADRVLSLPMHPYLDAATQNRVIDGVRAAIAGRRGPA